MKKIIIANWKCNPSTQAEARLMLFGLKKELGNFSKSDVVICPPFVYINEVAKTIGAGIFLGAQNCLWENRGPFTGEISPKMLKDQKVKYVILGHSERIINFGETIEIIAKKLRAVLAAGLLPIVCLGESSEEKKQGKTFDAVESRLQTIFSKVSHNNFAKIIIAYEPYWAVGSKNNCSPDSALTMALFIRKKLNQWFGQKAGSSVRIIYGGSVDSQNAKDYFGNDIISGLLVGLASLDVKEFIKIVKSVGV